MTETATWYCTRPAERTWAPGDPDPLPEAEICTHPECFVPDTVELGGTE